MKLSFSAGYPICCPKQFVIVDQQHRQGYDSKGAETSTIYTHANVSCKFCGHVFETVEVTTNTASPPLGYSNTPRKKFKSKIEEVFEYSGQINADPDHPLFQKWARRSWARKSVCGIHSKTKGNKM